MTRESGDSLLDFVSQVAGVERLKVEENLGDGYVRLRVSEAERRQATHDIRWVEDAVVELLRNSRDAGARRIFLATSKDPKTRRVVCVDDGEGIPEHLHDAVFEPRVTSKLESMTVDSYGVHGRGMALYSIQANVAEARVVASEPGRGTAVVAVADTTSLPERKDQSTWPQTTSSSGKVRVTRGPHNILRSAVEFALAHPQIELYVGSATDLLATMRRLALDEHQLGRLFDEALSDNLPLWQRAATAVEPGGLCRLGSDLYGLQLSLRNAQRILGDEIDCLEPVSSRIGVTNAARQPTTKVDLVKDRRSLRIDERDLDKLRQAAAAGFASIADKYYLETDPQITVTANNEEIRIRLRMRKLE